MILSRTTHDDFKIMEHIQDVIIIGGGPSGSTAATLLARQGHSVTVLEKEKFPREHVGESLLPFCYPLFQELGILDEMKKRFVRKSTVRFMSPDASTSTNWCFNHVIKDESHLSFHVKRSEFDKVLLDNSRKHGATVREATRVRTVEFEDDLVRVHATDEDGNEQVHCGRFIIDASGRDGFLSKRNKWRKPHKGFERTALWTHWENVKELKGGLEDAASIIVYLGGEKRGWSWVFPLGKDRVTVGFVVDSFYLRDQKAALKAENDNWLEELYARELRESPFIKDLLEGANTTMPLKVEGNYSYYSEKKYGDNFAIVGDASRFVDPIFSSGVYLSMKSSSLLAKALDEKLSAENSTDNTPIANVYKRIAGAYDIVYRLISLFYDPHAISFAEAGRAFNKERQEHEDALAAGHFIIAGDFFEEDNQKYHNFLDTLADSRRFEMYRKLVIQRTDFQTDSCGDYDPAELFPEERVNGIPHLNGVHLNGTQHEEEVLERV